MVICIFILIGYPTITHAGIFDVISKLITPSWAENETSTENKNIQTINLLKPGAKSTATVTPSETSEIGLLSVASGPLRISTEDEVYIPDEDAISVYVVKKTDNLNSIAKLYNISVNTIVWANDLSDRKVSEGQVLTILPVSGIRHTVVKGDTLKNIASKYTADDQDIAIFNGVTTQSILELGSVLLIPDGEIAEEVKQKNDKDVKKIDKKTTEVKVKKSIKTILKNLVRGDSYYVRPISGGSRTTGIHGNNAVDLAAPLGTSIAAAASGKVIVSKSGGYNGGYGNYVVISHPNGTQTLYAHNSQNLVNVGDNVTSGQVIAKVGSTGKSTGAHVHFEVRGARNPF